MMHPCEFGEPCIATRRHSEVLGVAVTKQHHNVKNFDIRLDTPKKTKHNTKFGVGGMSEWLKEADCKSVGLAPTLVRIQLPPPQLQQLLTCGQSKHGCSVGESFLVGVAQW